MNGHMGYSRKVALYYGLAYKGIAQCLSSSINVTWKIGMVNNVKNYRELNNRMRISVWQKMPNFVLLTILLEKELINKLN